MHWFCDRFGPAKVICTRLYFYLTDQPRLRNALNETMIPSKAHHDPYSLSSQDGPERGPRGFSMNLLLLVGVLLVGLLQLEQDWWAYKGELVIFHSIKEGVTPEDMPKRDMGMHLESLMPYKNYSQKEFFVARWWPKVPLYLGLFVLPLLVGVGWFRWQHKAWFQWAHGISFGFFFLYATFFFLNYFSIF